jgi:copper-sensing transcriptional repressor csoR
MICDDKYCNDILIQLSAIKNSVKSLSNHILEKHIHSCIENDLQNNDTSSMKEVIELFKKFNN